MSSLESPLQDSDVLRFWDFWLRCLAAPRGIGPSTHSDESGPSLAYALESALPDYLTDDL